MGIVPFSNELPFRLPFVRIAVVFDTMSFQTFLPVLLIFFFF